MAFASLFPVSFKIYRMPRLSHRRQDNVGRLVVDGVVDGDDYFSSEMFQAFIVAFSLTSDC